MFLKARQVQNMQLQNVPFWSTDYFELKALKKQQVQEGLSNLPRFP